MLPIIIAVASRITGPCTSISPLTAPAITAAVAVMLPLTTVLGPTLTEPLHLMLPTILAPSANTSSAVELPVISPVTSSLPSIEILPLTIPCTSSEPSDVISPVTFIPLITTPTSIALIFLTVLIGASLITSGSPKIGAAVTFCSSGTEGSGANTGSTVETLSLTCGETCACSNTGAGSVLIISSALGVSTSVLTSSIFLSISASSSGLKPVSGSSTTFASSSGVADVLSSGISSLTACDKSSLKSLKKLISNLRILTIVTLSVHLYDESALNSHRVEVFQLQYSENNQ